MLQLYGSGIEAGIPGLMDDINLAANAIKTSVNADFDITGATLDNTMNLIANGSANDYSGALGQINGSLSVMAGADRQVIIPVYIGQERIETDLDSVYKAAVMGIDPSTDVANLMNEVNEIRNGDPKDPARLQKACCHYRWSSDKDNRL